MKDNKFINKVKTSINNQKQYKIFKSKQFYGILFLLFFSYMFVVSIVQVSGFTTIYSYTFGFLFGYYSYFIFAAFIYYGLILLFNIDIRIEKYIAKKYNKVFNFSWIVYIFLVIGISLIIESSLFIYRTKTAFPSLSLFSETINTWWTTFTSSTNAWLPNVLNSGFFVSLFISLIASWSGFPITIIIGTLFILYFGFYVYYGSPIKILKNTRKDKTKLKKQEIEEHKTKILDLSFENDNILEQQQNDSNTNQNDDIQFNKTVTISIDNVDNIFNIEEIETIDNNEKFINEKTTEFNIKNNLIKEFDVEKELDNEKKLSDPGTFEFELDVFNTITSSISNDDVINTKMKE